MQFNLTWEKVLSGAKTQTRRIALPEPDGTGEFPCEMIRYPNGIEAVCKFQSNWKTWRVRWQVGKVYAVQPGRKKKAVGHIRITGLRREALQDITLYDACMEGVNLTYADIPEQDRHMVSLFPDAWQQYADPVLAYKRLWNSLHSNWHNNPQVWVIEFELVVKGE